MIDLSEPYAWLYWDGIVPCLLTPAEVHLAHTLESAAKSPATLGALWKVLDIFKQNSREVYNELHAAQLLVECARAAAWIDNPRLAAEYLHAAEQRSRNSIHQHAVVSWMLGCVWHALGDHTLDYCPRLQAGVDGFEALARCRGETDARKNWYLRTRQRMEQILEQTLDGDCSLCTDDLPPSGGAGRSGGVPKPPAAAADLLSLFTICAELSCGRPIPSGVDPDPVGHIEVDQVLVDGVRYRVESLTGRRVVNALPLRPHTVILAVGTSMNKANIDDGDLVLLRVQNECYPNDIVAIELLENGVDTRATLKRWTLKNNLPVLMPESTDPHDPIPLTWKDEYHIHGVAVAVFKRVEED